MEKGIREAERDAFSMWIEKEKRILSFHKVEGYELRQFSTLASMMGCALALSMAGYLVQ